MFPRKSASTKPKKNSQDNTTTRLLQQAVNFLSCRSRSEKEVVDYLKKKLQTNPNPDLIKEIITKLRECNLLNNQDFAHQWFESRIRQGKGPFLIRAELIKKGIDQEDITHLLNQVAKQDWAKKAKATIEKQVAKWHNLPLEKQKGRAFRLLTSRGFPLDIVRGVIDASFKNK